MRSTTNALQAVSYNVSCNGRCPAHALCSASGVVFAFIRLTSFTNVRSGEIPVTVILVAVIFLSQQVYEGLFLRDNVSNLSYVLGSLVGAFFRE